MVGRYLGGEEESGVGGEVRVSSGLLKQMFRFYENALAVVLGASSLRSFGLGALRLASYSLEYWVEELNV